MNRRDLLLVAGATLAAGCTTTSGDTADPAAKRNKIDAAADSALTKLYGQVPESRELVRKARGVLVLPDVVSAGFIVGGTYGEGALRKGGVTTAYYSVGAASVGLLAGAQSKAMYLLFMTEDALRKFEASEGWTAGADASVSMMKTGASAGIDTQTAQQPVVGYVLTNAGLMANLAIDGTKITRLDI